MRKPKMLVHPSYARCIDSEVEAERLLAAGWVYARPKPSKEGARRRVSDAKRRAAGQVSQLIWMTPEQHAAVKAAERPGESLVMLLMRLLGVSHASGESVVDGDN